MDLNRLNKINNEMNNKKTFGDRKPLTNIFFKFGKGEREERIIRLAGDFYLSKKHWIGDSVFNNYELFSPESFEGDDKLPMQITCNDWDDESEKYNKNGGCTICRVRNAVDSILRSEDAKQLDEETLKNLDNMRKKCFTKTHGYINIIDRTDTEYLKNNPENGYKIADFNNAIITGISEIAASLEGRDIASPDEGVDIKITKIGNGTETKYNVSLVLEKGTVKVTPLTDVERSWELHDLQTICGKRFDNSTLYEKLAEEPRELIDNVYSTDVETTVSDEDIPF